MMFNVLIEYHPMIGVDLHEEITTTVPPVPVPFAPHMTAALLNWIIPASMSKKTFATFTQARMMQRGTDIQSFIPHIPLAPPAIALAPVLTVFSGSKSYWGPRSVVLEGTPVAVALLVFINMNLNCGDIPMPSGYVIAPNTVVTGMTLGDIIGGLYALMFDTAAQFVMNKIFGPFGPIGGGILGALLGSPLGFSFNANGHGVVGILGRTLGIGSDLARNAGETLGDTLTGRDTTPEANDRKAIFDRLNEEGNALHDDPLGLTTRKGEEGKDTDLDKAKQIPGNLPIVRGVRGLKALGDNPSAEPF